jgi:molybdopterin-biosynthesis enzyme MoeA-like protein
MKTIRASHIAIGTELTSAQTLNTNSPTIAKFLQEMGIKNQMHVVVPDDRKLIMQSFDFVAPETDWLFVYGGLAQRPTILHATWLANGLAKIFSWMNRSGSTSKIF